ncbi:MAG: metalloregulator ArsR/SmtB family transcription factor [Cellvibrionaceae bacterium]
MTELSDSQEKILLHLKQRGPQTAKTLAGKLAMTTMGARQHLAALRDRGLVEEAGETKQGRGRPVRPWRLTGPAHSRFPDAHSQMTVDLIASVRDVFGEQGVDQLIDRRTQVTTAQYREAVSKHASLAKKVQALARLRSEEGYMAEAIKEDSRTWLLVENHCPICTAASTCQGFCRSELETFQALFNDIATVERIEHILQGARRCAYIIRSELPGSTRQNK